MLLALVVNQIGIVLIGLVVTSPHCLLQGVDSIGVKQVSFAILTPLIIAPHIEDWDISPLGKSMAMAHDGFLGNNL